MDASPQHLDMQAFLDPIRKALEIHKWKKAFVEATPTGGELSVRIPFDQFPDRRAILVIQPLATGRSDHPIKLRLMVVASLKNFHTRLAVTMKELYEKYTNDPNSQGGCFLQIEENPDQGDTMHIWWQCEFTPSDERPLDTDLLLKLFGYALAGYEVLFFTLHAAELLIEHTNTRILARLPRTKPN